LPTFVVRLDKDQEVLQTVQTAVTEAGITAATVSLIGAVQEATVSVMPKADPLDDILTTYNQPFEVTGTGEVIDGKVHVHVCMGGDGSNVIGHLHRAVVQDWFVRAYVTPLD
jgi:uncharacterized protein